MKKFTILALLLMLIGIAAADVYTIGDGTSTQSYIPFYGLYDYGWSKVIYTAAELSTAGLSAGQIDGIGFEVGYTPSNYVSVDQRVFIRHTTATELDATYPDNTQFQNVYQANYTWNGTGWHYIMFSSPFMWDGTSNIEILWENWDGAWASGPSFTYTSTSPSYLAAYKYQDGSFPTVGGSTTYSRPNIQIVTPSTNPPAPATLVSPAHQSTLTDAIVTLSWSASDGAIPTGYTLFYGTTNPPLNEVDLGPLTSHVLNDLPFETLYYWQVVPYNAMGNATGCPIWEFTTMADPTQPLPYMQDFNSGTSLTAIGWSGTFSIMANHGTSGSNGLSRNLYSSATTTVATTPPIGPLAPDSELKFDYRYVNWSGYPATATPLGTGDQLQIQVSTDGVTFDTLHTIDMNNHVTSTDFAPVTINLSAYSGTIYLKFDATRGTGDYFLDIDNVLVREVPAGAPGAPTLLSPLDGATGLSKYGFNLSWTPSMTGGTPTSYDVFMGSDPETMFDDGEVFTGIIGTSFNPVLDGGISFEYNDLWYWTVVAINAEGDALQETPFSFRIEQDPTVYVGPDTPWTEGFEGATFPPFGWTMNDADSDGENWFSYNADGSAHTGLKSAASASWTSTTYALNPDNWLITPPIAIPATGEYLMEYYVGAQDPDFPQDHYGLYISTTGTAPADFSLLFEETLMDGAWYYRSQNLASYAGQTVHFAFRHFDSYDWFYMKIDDVTVRELPETPTLAISPTEWDFGSVQLLNPTTPKSFSLSNVGAGTIDILAGDIQLTGDVEGNFVLVANNLPVPLSGSNTYTFTVQFIPQSLGPKTATVTIEDNITREIHTITLSGEGIEEPIASVIALQGAVESQVNVRLNWASIYGDPTQAGYVHWDDSIQRGNVGAGATPFHAVAKYGTEVTALATGKVLDGVMIHLAEEPQLITSVKVWTGTDADLTPVTMVHEETVSDLTVGWNYVALTTPVPITGTDAIYVGYLSTGMDAVYPASTDGLTAVDGRGNVLEISGSWNTLTASDITGSWLIHAHFAEAAPIMAGRRPVVLQNVAVNNVEMTDEALRNSPVKARMNGNVDRVLRGFNVYRDGVQINSEIVAAYTYLDEGLAADTYDYAAQAVHYSANGPISGTIPVTVDPPADPIALPFLEDWASSGYDTNMWSIGSSNWGMNTGIGNPAPSASFGWSPRVTDYSSILASYEFDATGIASVRFSFDLNLDNYDILAENTMTWEVWDGTAWNTLGSYSSLDDDLGWTTYAYDISAYAANRVFKIRFVAAGEDSYSINYWYLDNIYMKELVDTDMSVVSLTGMSYGFQNTPIAHTVTVKNNGTEPVSNYTVYLKSVTTRAILGQESFTDPLAADATNAVEFTWNPTSLGAMDIYGEVYVADDAEAGNNTTDPMAFNVYQEGILFEGFEGGVIPANWTVLNADGGTQVWQAQTINPYSGTYAARVRYETSSLDNDDWLITPPLQVTSGTTDNISFWMRTYSGTDADAWQVLISTTDTNPASFTMIDEGDGMLANYVQKSYNLDSYGDAIIYLAVRYMGAYDWYLYVDEFVGPPVYEPASLDTPEVTISTVGSNVVLNWDAIPYATSYEVMAADAPEGPYTLAATVTAPTYSSAAASKKFYKVIAKAGATRSIVSPVLSLEQQLLQDEMDRAARSRQ